MSFKHICGQEKPIAFLKGAMEKGRLSHAYLFFGMRGVGKRTTAGVFARALNCKEGLPDACERCPSCLKAVSGNHPDIVVIQPSGQFIRIQEIREIQSQMRFRPFEGRTRVFLIFDAETMNIAAANALLKTLEEPSPSNIMILVSSRPQQLPMTIISRCQQLRFRPLSREEIAGYLMAELNLGREEADILAASAEGSIGRAVEMQRDSDLKARDAVIDCISGCRQEDPLGNLSLAGALGGEREVILKNLDILRTWYRDVLVYGQTGDRERLIYRNRLETVKSFAEKISVPDVLKNIESLNQAEGAVERNANKQLTLETLLFKLVHPAGS
jgi:DNA polymerase-3 subunit delta'